jgi:hypothetical protein
MQEFEKSADKKWREYWDDLMLKSNKPVPWGTIVEEKPEHGDKSTTEDTKLHRFKKDKKRFKDSKD